MAALEAQNIDQPHETRPYKAHGHMDVVTLATSPWQARSNPLAVFEGYASARCRSVSRSTVLMPGVWSARVNSTNSTSSSMWAL